MSDAGVYEVYLQGSDGQFWDVLNGTQGLWLEEGAAGLRMPDFTMVTEDLANGEGAYFQGLQWGSFDVETSLMVGDPQSVRHPRAGRDWLLLDRSVARSIGDPAKLVRWVTVSSSGGYRSLWCRPMARKPQSAHEPHRLGQQRYRCVHVAHSPFYEGLLVRVPIAMPSYAAGTVATVAVHNSGQREAALTWEIGGPIAVSVGVGDQLATLPELPAGRSMVWDTAEHTLIRDDGVNLRSQMQGNAPRPTLPAGAGSVLSVRRDSSVSGGTVAARWRPRYLEPAA